MNDSTSRVAASAFASGVAESCTLPMDVCKVRLQVGGPKYAGFQDVFTRTLREEGAGAFFRGFSPALLRQVSYSSLSFVLYEPIRDAVSKVTAGKDNADGKPNFATRLLAGGFAGGFGIAVMNPTEVLKTQMQASVERVGMVDVARRVFKNDGILGFWAGVYPNVVRCFLVNAAEIGTYDQAKSMIVPYTGDNVVGHVAASGIAGLTSAVTSTPVDVVKTRFMNAAGTGKQYSGMLDAGMQIYREEGLQTLYSGFAPIVIRKLIWCSVFFVLYEKTRTRVYGYMNGVGEFHEDVAHGAAFRLAAQSTE